MEVDKVTWRWIRWPIWWLTWRWTRSLTLEVNMVADMEVDMVADMEANMVKGVEVDKMAEDVAGLFPMWAGN